VTFEVDCSKGTYVRTLCHDLGQLLGTGAHLTALRRTRSGSFSEVDCVTLEQLEADGGEGRLLPLAEVLREVPALEVDAPGARRLADGIPPEVSSLSVQPLACGSGQIVRLMQGALLLAVARYAPGREKEKRGDFELLRVFNQNRPV